MSCCRDDRRPRILERARPFLGRDLGRLAGLQSVPRRSLDERALRELRAARSRFRRLSAEAIKRAHTEYIAATIPGAGLLILPNTSHFRLPTGRYPVQRSAAAFPRRPLELQAGRPFLRRRETVRSAVQVARLLEAGDSPFDGASVDAA
jgi:hypothetical protein